MTSRFTFANLEWKMSVAHKPSIPHSAGGVNTLRLPVLGPQRIVRTAVPRVCEQEGNLSRVIDEKLAVVPQREGNV
jgi:hypothetical protein